MKRRRRSPYELSGDYGVELENSAGEPSDGFSTMVTGTVTQTSGLSGGPQNFSGATGIVSLDLSATVTGGNPDWYQWQTGSRGDSRFSVVFEVGDLPADFILTGVATEGSTFGFFGEGVGICYEDGILCEEDFGAATVASRGDGDRTSVNVSGTLMPGETYSLQISMYWQAVIDKNAPQFPDSGTSSFSETTSAVLHVSLSAR